MTNLETLEYKIQNILWSYGNRYWYKTHIEKVE